MSALLSYWPTLDHVEQCLRTEAETIGDALLLAVHEPVVLLRRSDQTGQDVAAGEHELLSELMRPVGDGSAVVVAITGASGVGKSHMVRWLRAQLERHARRSELVVVTIPKTVSLRRVVELVLEPLEGEVYERLLQDLGRTADAMSPDMAAALLGTALAEELDPYARRIAEDVRSARLAPEWGPRVTIARHLRTIIRDASVQDAWFRQVLLRIVRSSLSGTADPADRQFRAADLEPSPAASSIILNVEVHRALQYLASAEGKYRETAAEILQEVLDPALRTIFRFTEALQQRTVQEVVDDIRRQLLVDGKELVLLIEDLAALSGIQQPLLDIMIAEADSGGVRVRAPIRTAVAVTDGFLAARQTVLTRARGQWVVPSEGLTEEAVVKHLVELTGRYLNAARFGVQRLQAEFQRAGGESTDLYGWVPRFEETVEAEAADKLAAFGRSQAGYSLFPFNAFAIQSLAAHALKIGDAWILNPRSFINEVLRRTLRMRDAFEKGDFPPPDYVSPRLPSQVSLDLQYQGHPDAQRRRLESALYHWAGNPSRLDKIAPVSKALFDTFHLPWPFSTSPTPPPPRRSKISPHPPTPTPATPSPAIPSPATPTPPQSKYGQAVEEWRSESRMPQVHAHRTRLLLTTALQQRLDLGELALQGLRVETKWFWLPPENTVSNPALSQLHIKVAEPDAPIPAIVRAGLQALDRWEQEGKQWGYPGAESDYAEANALLEALERQVLPLILEEAERDAAILLSAIHRQSLLAGLGGAVAPSDAPLKQLFAAMPTEPALHEEGLSGTQRHGIEARQRALAQRGALQDRLKLYLSCFQGTGSKPFGVDVDRIKKAWRRGVPDRWTLALRLREDLHPDAADALERLSPASLDVVVRAVAGAVESVRPTVAGAFGDDHARVAWREAMQTCIERSVQLSLWPSGARESEVRKAIEHLSTEPAEAAILRSKRMPADDPQRDPLERLAALSSVPLPRLISLHQDVEVLQQFMRAQDQLIRGQTTIDDEAALRRREELLQDLRWEK